MIRILVVDDQELVRMGLRMLVEPAPDMEILAEADNGADAVRLADRLAPDVVLMDLRMPGLDGIEATRRILAGRPGARIVTLTTFDDDDHLYPALAAGACGFLVKDTPPGDLLEGIRRAAAGGAPFSPDALRRLVSRAVRDHIRPREEPVPAGPGAKSPGVGTVSAPRSLEGISPREREVLALIGTGLSNKDIAQRLHLGITTVKTHVASLMTKTGRDNRIRLALLAHSAGLVTD
ncbi:response regulator [Streptomyces sp. NPDC018031]|uniref:response regulator n=1 Tax=Streptomyces sp. NPDC018031 TaxID=3365033 RepID=UPI0037BDD567